jgi:hypothetical protein
LPSATFTWAELFLGSLRNEKEAISPKSSWLEFLCHNEQPEMTLRAVPGFDLIGVSKS